MATKDTRLARLTTLLGKKFFRMRFVQATNSWYRIA
jgi:hypothetical protein